MNWLENRKKWIAFLRDPARKKVITELESKYDPERRCCLGHGCACLIPGLRDVKESGFVTYENEGFYAPSAFMDSVGLFGDGGQIYGGGVYFKVWVFNSLSEANDETEMTPVDIADFLEATIEGGEGSPFRPLDEER